jgi:hypothetical protein
MRRDWHNFSSLVMREMHDMIFCKQVNENRKLMSLALKVIKGDREFTDEELQLQANEPEALEKMLKEIREFMERG